MTAIRILPDRVANQIAAGEVIERPAAVVKELVENSLDAGATQIEVEFRHGGRSLIRIEDNGGGMSRDDALLSLERHATSKLLEAADLDRLGTFGFRGEALPSIASVSRFEMQTRPSDSDEGSEVLINGGKFVHVRDCGRPKGTRIIVSHLFNSVPARRKFLKSDTTESAHIIHCVRLYALACPQTAFTLIEDDRVIFRSPQCATLEERVAEIFGRQMAEGLLALETVEPGLRLSGLIGKPAVSRATRHEMITFINRRPVDSRTLNYALIESFHDAIPKGRYPVAVLFLELDPASVDVNVHPAKREVRFRDESRVRGFVIRAVLDRLRNASASSLPPDPVSTSDAVPISPGEIRPITSATVPTVDASRESRIAAPFPVYRPALPLASPPSAPIAFPNSTVAPPQAAATPPSRPARSNWRYLGLIHATYALFETDAGLGLLDRRAALERIWFERLDEQYRTGTLESQRLLLPVPVELDAISSVLLVDKLSFLEKHGIDVGEFGRNFFRIESIPSWLEPGDAEAFLRDLIGAFRDGRIDEKNSVLAREELARLSTNRALRLPDNLNETEAHGLVSQLFACRQPMTNPSGRPTFIELSHGELARRFQK
ncbi:MAG TPA: DNA mismatch repair endonuclease MutL [Opitutaceae bacterium]|nr:DNA mismatch repair endonuclease MutL [Opitutaceae bacterium]